MINRLSILLLFSIISSCSGSQDKRVEYYPSGEIKSEFEVDENGLKRGLGIDYWNNGNVKHKYNWHKGKLNGRCEEYYESGKIESMAYFKNGKQDSLMFGYFENGSLSQKGYYKEDKLSGYLDFYYESGNIKLHSLFEDSVRIFYVEYADSKEKLVINSFTPPIDATIPRKMNSKIENKIMFKIGDKEINKEIDAILYFYKNKNDVGNDSLSIYSLNGILEDEKYYFIIPPVKFTPGIYYILAEFIPKKKSEKADWTQFFEGIEVY
jgi:MORN repeat variant